VKRLLALVLPALMVLAAITYAGAGVSAQDEATPVPGSSTVYIRNHPELGAYFTDRDGMTLYVFTKDTEAGVSTCNGDCATAWMPFTSEEPLTLPQGVDGELTTITREDGSTQVAYNGIPLYRWAQDQVAGDVTGQGVGGVWFVAAPGQQMGVMASPVASPEASPIASPAAAGEVTVELNEFDVIPSATVFKVGETYSFVATNTGDYTHEMLIEAAGANDVPLEADGKEAEIANIDAGTSATLEWTFTEAGTYQLTCHVRDHYAMGMAITITVVE